MSLIVNTGRYHQVSFIYHKCLSLLFILVGFIRFYLSAHGDQLYKRISLESSLILIV